MKKPTNNQSQNHKPSFWSRYQNHIYGISGLVLGIISLLKVDAFNLIIGLYNVVSNKMPLAQLSFDTQRIVFIIIGIIGFIFAIIGVRNISESKKKTISDKQNQLTERVTQLEDALKKSLQMAGTEIVQDKFPLNVVEPSGEAVELAEQIPDDAYSYALTLKALAEKRTNVARKMLVKAVAEKKTELAKIYETRALIEDYAGNYGAAVEHYEKTIALNPNALDIQSRLVMSLYGSGDYNKGVKLGEKVLSKLKAESDTDPIDIGTSMNSLAELYRNQGRYTEAEPLFNKAFEICVKALGEDHPLLAVILSNLAGLYEDRGKYARAEPLYKKSLSIRIKTLGTYHPSVATNLNNLAGLYGAQGKYVDAEPLYKKSLEIIEEVLGKDHPYLATMQNNLAGLYQAQDKYAEAEPLYKRSLAIKEKALGEDHPELATTLNDLALLYESMGKYNEAEPLFKKSIEIYKKALGEDHSSMAITLNNLAGLHRAQRRFDEAEPLYEKSLAISEKMFGKDHSKLTTTLNNLAEFYRIQGRYIKAEQYYKRAISIIERKLPDHPNLAVLLINYALMLDEANRHDEAKQMRAKAEVVRAKHRDRKQRE
ncbi:MAG: tetratricopeptide repeat protein [Calditrichaeota bacterium]|nr:tetratricopeptide repeat protein [Calditrichota bacterium]